MNVESIRVVVEGAGVLIAAVFSALAAIETKRNRRRIAENHTATLEIHTLVNSKHAELLRENARMAALIVELRGTDEDKRLAMVASAVVAVTLKQFEENGAREKR